MDLLSDLNDAQRRAVTHVDGPLLVLAGAGSGKTRVITRRVGYLIQQGVAPWHILAITFTNKAAGEMRNRVAALGLPSGATVGTFHAVCVRLLREFAAEAGLNRDFSIYDADDQLRCVKQAMDVSELSPTNVSPAAVAAAISRAKNALTDPVAYAQAAQDVFARAVAGVYKAYQQILRTNQALDFDDLLMRMAFLLRDRPDIRQVLGQRYRYVLIDEYQDTNHAQYVIAHGIAMEHENICATGDPDQSIYAWRGANIRNIMEFEADYPNAVVVRLEENYRSTAPILTAAGNLIARNRQRKDKRLVATRQGGVDVKIVRLADERAEAAEVVETIRRLRGEGVNYSQMAIFYRVNALSRVLEDAIRRNSIPYQMARGVEFYNRAEIKDVLAYLKLMLNPADGLSCRRIINVPARGIGDVTIGKLEAAAKARKVSLLAACRDPAQAGLPAGVGAKVAAFAKLIDELRNFPAGNVKELLERVIERSGIEAALADDPKEKQAFENVGELVSSAAEFDKYHPEATLADYLYEVSLVSDVDTVDSQAGAVTLMTLHAAKGLEFPVVFIVGLERGLLPFVRANGDKTDLEEERRLLFVGVTRAKDRLMLTTAMHRTLRGVQTRQVESAFLAELGSQTVTRLDKAPMAEPVRRGPISLEEFNRSAARRHEDGFYEEVDGRAMVEAMEMADTLPSEFAGIRPGRRVHHPMFGQGKVVQVSGTGAQTRAVVEFDRHGRKILILQHAHLEPLDEF